MRAVGFYEFGEPEVLQVIDVPEVEAGPGDVLWTTKKGIKKKVYGRGSR